jgi:hypothetical protein
LHLPAPGKSHSCDYTRVMSETPNTNDWRCPSRFFPNSIQHLARVLRRCRKCQGVVVCR